MMRFNFQFAKEALLMNKREIQKSIDNAEASINMEGYQIPDYCKELCKKLLNNEVTLEEYIKTITDKVYS